MSKITNLFGKKFGRLTVISQSPLPIKNSKGKIYYFWEVECECGVIKKVQSCSLVLGKTKSCGCLNVDTVIRLSTTHGMSRAKEYRTWRSMLNRCRNPLTWNFKNYGGRGITVCERWQHSFENFFKDMGERSEGLSLDRIDNDKGYYKENCRWASRKEQARNKRGSIKINYCGKSYTLRNLSEQYGINYKSLYTAIKRGTALELAVPRLIKKKLDGEPGDRVD